MKNTCGIRFTLLLLSGMVLFSCTKKEAVAPPVEVEENIAFSINPDPGGGVAAATTETYPFKITISSKLTSAGVSIDLTTRKEADGSVAESKTVDPPGAVVDVAVGTLSPGWLYNVTVVVTSKKTRSNLATKTFKVARK